MDSLRWWSRPNWCGDTGCWKGWQAARRFLEFFAVTIRNTNTRMAYYRAVLQFFAWCDRHQLGQLVDIKPLHVAAYIDALQHAQAGRGSEPFEKLLYERLDATLGESLSALQEALTAPTEPDPPSRI